MKLYPIVFVQYNFLDILENPNTQQWKTFSFEIFMNFFYSVEGSGSGSICDETSCKFGGTCELSEGSNYHCTCKNSCDAIR